MDDAERAPGLDEMSGSMPGVDRKGAHDPRLRPSSVFRRLESRAERTQKGLKPGFYPGLDLLRGFAAVSVVIYHVIEHFNWTSFPIDNMVCLWFRLGWIGVDLFFVISGFVIVSSALKLIEQNPEGFVRTFCKRRLARIVPLHYLTCILWVIFIAPALLFHPMFGWHASLHLGFVHNWWHQSTGSINGPNWSVAVEMQFYLLVLVLARSLRRANVWMVLGSCALAAWTWRALAFALFHGVTREGVPMTWLGTTQLPGMLDLFGFGIALALVFHRDTTGRLFGLCHSIRWLLPLATAGAAMVTMRLYWPHSGVIWTDWRMVVLWRTTLGGTCLLAVLSACALNDRWFLALTSPLRYLGTISYGIYLWHMLVLTALKPLFPGSPAAACAWVLSLTLLLATLSWHFFEKPLLDRFGQGRPGSLARSHSVSLTAGGRNP
jgi:peptidoglycan/LPS O-acetylase OafA/YrhL